MTQSKVRPTTRSLVRPNVNGCADIQELIHAVKIAHERGALFFLAVQLEKLLEEHREKNGPPTAVELETLLAQAVRVM